MVSCCRASSRLVGLHSTLKGGQSRCAASMRLGKGARRLQAAGCPFPRACRSSALWVGSPDRQSCPGSLPLLPPTHRRLPPFTLAPQTVEASGNRSSGSSSGSSSHDAQSGLPLHVQHRPVCGLVSVQRGEARRAMHASSSCRGGRRLGRSTPVLAAHRILSHSISACTQGLRPVPHLPHDTRRRRPHRRVAGAPPRMLALHARRTRGCCSPSAALHADGPGTIARSPLLLPSSPTRSRRWRRRSRWRRRRPSWRWCTAASASSARPSSSRVRAPACWGASAVAQPMLAARGPHDHHSVQLLRVLPLARTHPYVCSHPGRLAPLHPVGRRRPGARHALRPAAAAPPGRRRGGAAVAGHAADGVVLLRGHSLFFLRLQGEA